MEANCSSNVQDIRLINETRTINLPLSWIQDQLLYAVPVCPLYL